MAFSRQKLDRFTKFISDINLELSPVANNRENDWAPLPGDTTDAKLADNREILANRNTAQTSSPLEGTTVKPLMALDIPIISGSLWNKYQLIHRRRLGGLVIVASESLTENDHYLIRRMKIAKDEVSSFRRRWLSHNNLCKTREVFEDDGKFYCVMEPAVVTLLHVCRCPEYPNEKQLIAIAKQVTRLLLWLSLMTNVNRCLLGLLT